MIEWISTAAAAEQLDLSPIMVRKLVESGELAAERLGSAGRGGRWLISAVDVARLAAERAANPPRRGPAPSSAPSAAALAKRRSRERQKEEVV